MATPSSTVETELAAKIEASGLLTGDAPSKPGAESRTTVPANGGKSAAPAKPAQTPPKAAEKATDSEGETGDADTTSDAEDATETNDDAGTEAGSEDQTEAHDDGETDESTDTEIPPAARKQIDALREQIAELKGMILGKGKDAFATADSGGAAASPGKADKKVDDKLTQVKAKIQTAKGDWKEIIEALGWEEVVDDLIAERTAKQTEKETAEKSAKQQQEAQQVGAANNVHRAINTVARGDPELLKVLGLGLHDTLKPTHLKTRSRIMNAAVRALEDSHEEVKSKQRKDPLTEREAILIGIKRVTGKDLTGSGTPKNDAQAKERAKMVRAAGGASTGKEGGKESGEQTETRLASSIDNFFATQK